MTKTPHLYTDLQMEEIQHFITEKFGEDGGYIAHEITSEYVHTDSVMVSPEGESHAVITFGMGAREMNSPTNFRRTELVLSASQKAEPVSVTNALISSELAGISKFPFREDTWFGPGHTINASDKFKEATGFSYFAFEKMPFSAKLTGIDDEIHFLHLVPLYEEEYDWCVENNTLAFLDKLYDEYGDEMYEADRRRDLFIPEIDEEELDNYWLMAQLGVDRETFDALCIYLNEAEEKGEEVSYESITQWLRENN